MDPKIPTAVIIATLDTKREIVDFFVERVNELGIQCNVVDASLKSTRGGFSENEKLTAMSAAQKAVRNEILEFSRDQKISVIVGLGGGTGAQIAASAMCGFSAEIPKMLITTMAFDPRPLTTDSRIILIPTIADLIGLNPIIRNVLRDSASIVAGLARNRSYYENEDNLRTIGVTALGVTSPGVMALVSQLKALDFEISVFHANGFGGSAFAKFSALGRFTGVIDYTIHELTNLLFDSRPTVDKGRFAYAKELPRVILPGGVNFFTRGPISSLDRAHADRPHYEHSPAFSHVALTVDEMAAAGLFLANRLTGDCDKTAIVLPMRGFSTEDRPGGKIENPAGRLAFANSLCANLDKSIMVERIDCHINDGEAASTAVKSFQRLLMRQN